MTFSFKFIEWIDLIICVLFTFSIYSKYIRKIQEEIKFSHLPECPIVVACVLNEFKADTGQIARFMFLSGGPGYPSSSFVLYRLSCLV